MTWIMFLQESAYFRTKYYALNEFYMFVDNGESYNVAAENAIKHALPENELESAIFLLVVMSRFPEEGELITPFLVEQVIKATKKFEAFENNQSMINDFCFKDLKGDYAKVLWMLNNRWNMINENI